MNMNEWMGRLAESRKPMPVLSFPSTQLMGVSVYQLTHDSGIQAEGIQKVAERTDAAAAVCMMDLSVEAEAFGCEIKKSENEIPTVVGTLIADEEEAEALRVPKVGDGRTGVYVEAAGKAKVMITDRPVFAGMIGPFSLAGRLMDVSEALVNCIVEPDFVHAALKKAVEFLTEYALAYKSAGLDGIMMAEPLSGLLSPDLEKEFSAPYVKQLIDAVQDQNFAVIYHNCGPNTPLMTESIYQNGAAAFHFGDAVDLVQMLEKMPEDKPVCGNISPSALFMNGTEEEIYSATQELMRRCAGHKNFVLSSGCDIPPASSWKNIDAFFRASADFYK
ncbi:uroporphyrinogen decarboxylase family protein [Lachnotalea sp. AF33-28]|jgi:uroporphyrinogen decarboxylase|uniref:uroporphyrinogen decarboxylase family protein n=1 Tax=Lachnotalea sp. AF33-28 TaxID=2292046 RepID=UPI000E4BE1D7|nr:uroporphyrinogen decarboxylase family protein [Lachnotalea sp. AF33-28]RHP29896.1 methyltransferase [Lachnotalea sp. AF33-28]